MEIFVNGPFRHRNRSTNWHCERTGYIVQYNLKLKVPRKMDIFIKTVNNGDINVTNIEGDFTVKNVNGRIQMKKITGSGKAHTVNGRVKVTFNRNPETNCSFRTINGDIELTFPKKPSADFFVKTFNGGIYSAYNVRYLPAVPSRGKRINGKFVYKCNRFQGIRIGNGGPKIKMDTLNGDILIALKKN